MDFEIVARAGLAQGEFAKILGVSRLTAHNYINGLTKPHRMVEKRIAKVLDLLTKLVVAKKLPSSVPMSDRASRVRMIEKLDEFIKSKVEL